MTQGSPPLTRRQREEINGPRREARKLAIELWRDGRSIAGIIMECRDQWGVEFAPRALFKMLARARRADPTIPPPMRNPEISAEDTRADLYAPATASVDMATAGPWDGDQ